ncbi:MAG TPA: acyltransferase family protein, partial [Candidatus Limnocylindrales bacterium]|nr:acyltransferase family protein [Candidatus Limnocylindrales bacterium]
TDPSRVYYGTDTRIFEILVGALGAMVLASGGRVRIGRIARWLAWPAFAVVLLALVRLADDDSLYYHGAALGLAMAAAILIAGVESRSGLARVLSLRPLVLVGIVSYGLYLWHFPIITFINQEIGPTSSPAIAALAIVLTLTATTASYIVVERPIRRGGALVGFRLTPRRLLGMVPGASGVVAAMIVVSTAGGVTAPAWSDPTGIVGDGGLGTPGPAIAITEATPQAPASPASSARPAVQTLGVVGDSVINSALPGIEATATRLGWTVVAASAPGCPIGLRPLFDSANQPSPFNARCAAVGSLHHALIAARPGVVIWEDLQSVLSRRASDGTFLPAGSSRWTADLIADWSGQLDALLASGAKVVIVMPPLRSQGTPGCQDVPMESRCEDLQRQDTIIRAATSAFWAQVRDRPGVHLIDVDPLLCPNGYPCPTTIAGVDVRIAGWDQTHFTAAGATWFAPRLLDLVMESTRGSG